MSASWLATVGLTLAASACAVDVPAPDELPVTGQAEEFAAYMQPLLEQGCGSLDCHGQAGRPLRLYGLYGLRLSSSLRGFDASDGEIAANMIAIAGLDPAAADPQEHWLVQKPLSTAAGGIDHVGGEIWLTRTNPVYLCFMAWLRDGLADPSDQDICTEAL